MIKLQQVKDPEDHTQSNQETHVIAVCKAYACEVRNAIGSLSFE